MNARRRTRGREPEEAARLRRMIEQDVPAIMRIETLAYPFPWTDGIFRDCIRAGYCCRVLEQAGEVIGYSVMSAGAGEAHVLNLCVRPESRRAGHGRLLLADMIEFARRLRASALFLEVRPSNQAARDLYASMGFNEAGVRVGYYPAERGREDALILARHL